MIELSETSDGVRLPIKAKPGSRATGIQGVHNGRLKVAVSAPPEKGKANDAIAALLAELLQVRRAQITLIAGATATEKVFLFTGIAAQELMNRLRAILDEGKANR